jgi:hypothetical protein
MAYLTALAPRVGENLASSIKGGAPPMEVDEVCLVRIERLAETLVLIPK